MQYIVFCIITEWFSEGDIKTILYARVFIRFVKLMSVWVTNINVEFDTSKFHDNTKLKILNAILSKFMKL